MCLLSWELHIKCIYDGDDDIKYYIAFCWCHVMCCYWCWWWWWCYTSCYTCGNDGGATGTFLLSTAHSYFGVNHKKRREKALSKLVRFFLERISHNQQPTSSYNITPLLSSLSFSFSFASLYIYTLCCPFKNISGCSLILLLLLSARGALAFLFIFPLKYT